MLNYRNKRIVPWISDNAYAQGFWKNVKTKSYRDRDTAIKLTCNILGYVLE
jgi:hypothetical protein